MKVKGYPKITKEHKKKISKAMKGDKNHFYGKHRTEEEKRKLSLANMGVKGSNWQGGISAGPYCFEWHNKEFKNFIKERDDYTCQNLDCWGNSNILTVHHIDYVKKHCDPNNLLTLCRSCNTRANFNREYWQVFYKARINKKGGASAC